MNTPDQYSKSDISMVCKIAVSSESKVENIDPDALNFADKIKKQLSKRGWTKESVKELVNSPFRTKKAEDTRRSSDFTRNQSDAYKYFDELGNHVVVNTQGDVVQISNKNDPDWIEHS